MTLDDIINKLESNDYQMNTTLIKDLRVLQEDLSDAINDVIHADDETTDEVLHLRKMIDDSI